MIQSGLTKALASLEKVMNSVAEVRSEYEGVPDFTEDYKILTAHLNEDGELVREEVDEIPSENDDFDMNVMVDNAVHLVRGWGFSIEYDALTEEWSMTYRADTPEHMFIVQGEDLTDVVRTGLKALKDVESDLVLKKTFIEFCEIQLDEE